MLRISIIALAISVILALIRIYDFIREKYNVKVRVKGNYLLISDPSSTKQNETYILLSVVNIGKEPITISSAGLMSPNNKQFLLFKDSVKKTKLNSSDSVDYLMPEKNIPFDRKKYVACTVDTAGRTYYSHNFFKRYLRLKRIK